MSDVRHIIRHGRRIAVETQPDPPELAARIRKRAQRQQEAFAIVPLWWAKRACKNGGLQELLICADLLYRAWLARGKSFEWPNGNGSRKTKYRVLRRLERAGLIKVVWQPKKSPIITMTPPIK
jgi:hypothetical protein